MPQAKKEVRFGMGRNWIAAHLAYLIGVADMWGKSPFTAWGEEAVAGDGSSILSTHCNFNGPSPP